MIITLFFLKKRGGGLIYSVNWQYVINFFRKMIFEKIKNCIKIEEIVRKEGKRYGIGTGKDGTHLGVESQERQ